MKRSNLIHKTIFASLILFLFASNTYSTAQTTGTPESDLVSGFSDILVELFKDEKFKVIQHNKGWLSTSKSTGKQQFKQKKNRQYVFVIAYHKDYPVTPLMELSNEDGSQTNTLADFFSTYQLNHPLVPKKVKMLKAEFSTNVNGEFSFEIYNSSPAAYADVMVFEKKL